MRLNGVYRKLLQESGVTIIENHVEIIDPHTVVVDGRRIAAKYILVAVGSWPVVPKIPGSEHAITSNEAFYLPTLPPKVILVCGGYVGVEFAGIVHGLRVEVTQRFRGPLCLRGVDDDCLVFWAEEMRKRGVDLR